MNSEVNKLYPYIYNRYGCMERETYSKLPVAIAMCIQNMLLDVIAEIDVSQSAEVNV